MLKEKNGIKKISYTEGEKIIVRPNVFEVFPLKIDYIQIDGLKDSTIEDKINKLIKETLFNYAKEYTVDTIEVVCHVSGNFSNILSLSYNVRIRNKIDGDSYDQILYTNGLNIDLTTGNIIELSDCFAKGVSIKNIVSNAAHRSLAWDEKYLYGTWIEETGEIIRNDRSDLEDRVFKVLHSFEKGRYSYVIAPEYLTLYIL